MQSAPLALTPENIAAAERFVLSAWKRYTKERHGQEAVDLSNACKFSTVFAQALFGGRVRANYYHCWLESPTGELVDLTQGVQFRDGIPEDLQLRATKAGLDVGTPFTHDPRIFNEPEFVNGLGSLYTIVRSWVREFLDQLDWEYPSDWDWGWAQGS